MNQPKRQRRKKKTNKDSFEKRRNLFFVFFGVGVIVSMALLVLIDRIRNGSVEEKEVKKTVFTFEEDLENRDYVELSEMLYHPIFRNAPKDSLIDRVEKLRKRVTISEQMLGKAVEENEVVFSAKMKMSLLLEIDLTATKEGVDDEKTFRQLADFSRQYSESESTTLREWHDLVGYWAKLREYAHCKDATELESHKAEALAEMEQVGNRYLENGTVAAHMLNLIGGVYLQQGYDAKALYLQYSELFRKAQSDENFDRAVTAEGFADEIESKAKQ